MGDIGYGAGMDNAQDGKRLREVRRFVGQTQAQAGRHCGLSGGQISKYERGQSAIAVAVLQRLAEGFGCSAATLLKPPGAPLPSRRRRSRRTEAVRPQAP